MSRWCVVVAVFAGCYSPATERPCKVTCNSAAGSAALCPGQQECLADNLCHAPGDPTCPTEEIDAPLDLPDAKLVDAPDGWGPPYCFGTPGALLQVCTNTLSTEARTINANINTDSSICTFTLPNGPTVLCVIYGRSLVVQGLLRVTGSRPLVLLAVETIDISGTLDASSGRINGLGAGATSGSCSVGVLPSDFAGAAGGSFQGIGGNGGVAQNGARGEPGGAFTPTSVHGGCAGGAADPASGKPAGTPGRGGGALYLIAGSRISMGSGARLDVSGAGAGGGGGAGAGGGSGGLIGLDASMLVIAGELMANGGGGGQGYTGAGAASGGESVAPTMSAPGGAPAAPNHGGGGSAGTTSTGGDGGGGTASTRGGGGGGGAGWIYVSGGTLGPSLRFSPVPVHR
jgi:hypothetical protein